MIFLPFNWRDFIDVELWVPVIALSNLSSNLLQTLASGERVLSLLAEEPELKDVESAVDLKDVSRIDVENVSFAYGEEQILSDVSLSVKRVKS